MIARNFEDKPEIDYMVRLHDRLQGTTGIASIEAGTSNKGGASARLCARDDVITIDHANRRLTIKATSADITGEIVTRVKTIWRRNRGPKLESR